jgi:PTH1 family peptidyl-tRNA hydrolase
MQGTAPWLLVGLGNPGRKYAGHRHNIGFMVAEAWLSRHGTPGASDWREKFSGRFTIATGEFGRAVVLQPQTFMNRSGQSVQAAASFHRVPPSRIIVVHDEIDFSFGRMAIKAGGGHGGHNGLRDIVSALGSHDFTRIRVGVGRPGRGNTDVSNWVLSDFSAEERNALPEVVDRAQQAIMGIMTRGVAAAMNAFNQLSPTPDQQPERTASEAAPTPQKSTEPPPKS